MTSTPYNLDYLQQVFQGNDAMVRRILVAFEEQVPTYFSEMEKRWEAGRWRDLHPLAHKAKSSIGMLGMTHLHDRVVAIEKQSRSGANAEGLEMLILEARDMLNHALMAIRQDAASPGPVNGSNASHSFPARPRSRTKLRRA